MAPDLEQVPQKLKKSKLAMGHLLSIASLRFVSGGGVSARTRIRQSLGKAYTPGV